MYNSIDAYYQSLLQTISTLAILSSSSTNLDKRTPHLGLIRGDLYFVDGSRFHFRELVEVQDVVVRQMYSYHYQGKDTSLIFRYDDTAHFPDLSSFPHHKHIGHPPSIEPCEPPDLTTVLEEIEAIYPL